MGIKIKNLQTGEFEKFNIPALKGEKGEPGEIEPSEKVDYIGKQHSKLRDTMNANVDYIIKTAIGEFNYLDYEGQHIMATNSIEGHARRAILSGQTLVNLMTNCKDEYVVRYNDINNPNNNVANISMMKPNTEYTLFYKAKYRTVGEGAGTNGSLKIATSIEQGFIFTNQSLTTEYKQYVYRFTTSSVVDCFVFSTTDKYFAIKECVLLEGDYTQEDIPFFEGMQSVKMPVLRSLNHHPFSKDGLVCWLDGSDGAKGDNMWIDRTGNGNNATLVNFNHNDSNGWTGDSLKFDGVNAYCTLSPFVADSFTINMVVNIARGYGKSSSLWYLQGGLFDAEAPDIMNDFGLVVSEQGQIAAGTGNPDTTIRTTQTYLNKKVHISLVRDKEQGACRLYINGELQAEGSCNNNSLSDPTQFVLGAIATGLERKPIFDCYSIMVYNRVLTPKEINMSTEYSLLSYVRPKDHKSNILTVNEPVELRGIGDVKDTLDCLTGDLTQRIGEVALDGVSTHLYDSQVGGNEALTYRVMTDMIVKEGAEQCLADTFPSNVGNHAGDGIEGVRIIGNRLYLYIYKTRLSNPSQSGVMEYLKSNPMKVQYPMSQEVVKAVDLSDNHVYSYKDVTHYDCSSAEGSLVPTLSVKVPTDTQLTIQEQKATTQTLLIKNMDLQQSIKEVQAMNLAFNTALYNSFNSIREEVEDIKKHVSTNENLEGSF